MVGAIGSPGVPRTSVEVAPSRNETPGRFEDVMQRTSAASPAAAEGPSALGRVLRSVEDGQREMDRIIRLARSGRTFSAAELVGLQARVYRLSQELDLTSKLLEKATSGVKQAMSTQV
jgi:hypothetical protein